MTLRIKNTSDVAKIFGMTSMGSFANNDAIKNNPQIIKLLLFKQAKRQEKKKYSSLERNYYKKLIASSDKIKADREADAKVSIAGDKSPNRQQDVVLPAVIHRKTGQEIIKANGLISTSRSVQKDKQIKIEVEIGKIEAIEEKSLEGLPDLYWESDSGRYYHASIEKNLFGHYSLIKSWGGIRNKLGSYKIIFYETLESAHLAIQSLFKERSARKYKLIKSKTINSNNINYNKIWG